MTEAERRYQERIAHAKAQEAEAQAERDAAIVDAYATGGLNARQISDEIELTKARVSQIVQAAGVARPPGRRVLPATAAA